MGEPAIGEGHRNGIPKEKLIGLVLAKMPPVSLRLGLLELAGLTTNQALNQLDVSRSNRYRAIAGLRKVVPQPEQPQLLEVAAEVGPQEETQSRERVPVPVKGLSGNWSRARRYSMGPQDLHALYLKQNGLCYLCWDPLPENLVKAAIDHDHACCPGTTSCGKCVRGIACSSCNRLIGIARDDPYRLRRIADNLEAANSRVGARLLDARLADVVRQFRREAAS